jgi:hypothetical protein
LQQNRKHFINVKLGKQPVAKIQIAIEMLTAVSFLDMADG